MSDTDDRTRRISRKLRDVDSAEVAFRVKAFGWSLFALPPSALIGSHFGAGTRSPLLFTILCTIAGVGIVYFGVLAVAGTAGRIAGGLYFSSGGSTAGSREYSLAESLIVRGRFDDAVAELEQASAKYPEDPEPPLRLARVLRDKCARPEDAVRWFRIAAERSRDDAATEIGALREIIELFIHGLRTPRRALPDLARLASRHPDTAAGAWARREMTEIRQSIFEDEAT